MNKIIHYCWFGGKPLPKLAKKCIKSWQKYLPEYEIKRWDESNFDVNLTEFSKKAYELKKWAFVSDVARIHALKKYGGLYFDTDMLVTKNIDFLLENDFFVGWESEDNVAVGVLGVKTPNNEIIEDLFNIYSKLDFHQEDMHEYTIPHLLTNLLRSNYALKSGETKTQKLKNNTYVYSRDYFYPLSYDHKEKFFTKNTCMIHYYDASWISPSERKLIKIYRFLGREKGDMFIQTLRDIKKGVKFIGKVILFPLVKIIRHRRHIKYLEEKDRERIEILKKIDKNSAIAIYNPDWLGTAYATKELFENTLPVQEVYSPDYKKRIAKQISSQKPKIVIFSAFAIGWAEIARYIKKLDKKITIKTIWHGSNSMHIEEYDWARFKELFSLYREGVVSSLGFAKKSMAEFYDLKGYKTEFVMNTVQLKKSDFVKEDEKEKSDRIKIGLYASGDRWVKNFYNQICATSLVPKASVECIPINNKVYEFARIIKLDISGVSKPIPRNELLEKLSKNDINVYVTFVECAPLLPLESFELGVPCITGNNHHYWEGHELRDYLVVDEADNAMAIYKKIMYCLENKEKIMKLYSDWKKDYDKEVQDNLDHFLKKKRPKIALVVDTDNWAFANIAKQIIAGLPLKYDFQYLVMEEIKDIPKLFQLVKKAGLIHFFWRGHLSLFDNLDFEQDVLDKYHISTAVYDHLYLEKDFPQSKEIFKHVNNYYVCSNKLNEAYKNLQGIKKPEMVITDGIDLKKFYPKNLGRFKNIGEREIVIGWVGNSNWFQTQEDFKGVNTILKPAIEELKKDGYKLKMFFADKVERFIPHDEMNDYYAKIDLYVCTSKIEGTPNPILESMACGVPIISTDVGIVSDALGRKQKQMILEERSIKNLKEKILYLINNPKLFKEFSDENLKEIKSWSWEEKMKDFDKYFKKCLEK